MRRFLLISLAVLLAGCSMFEEPEGTVELATPSVHVRAERPTTTEEVVYCTADVKITNTGDKTIYSCTITAVAKSNKGIEHYVSASYEVNIPPSQSVYVTLEWSLVKQIDTSTETKTKANSTGTDATSTTTTKTSTASSNDETGWDKSSVRILDYYFD